MGADAEALDDALEQTGILATLRRMVSGTPVDVEVRAFVRSYRLRGDNFVPETSVAQDELLATISPTPLLNAAWPSAQSGPPSNDWLPKRGDFLVIRGRTRQIEDVDPMAVDDEIARIDMRLIG